jgi:arylsulfatase A-like enzyme
VSVRRRRIGGLAFVLGMLGLLAAGTGLLAPESWWALETLHEVDATEVQASHGKSYTVPFTHEAVATSSRDHVSTLIVLEDGRPLVRDNILDHIRQRGGGLFAHWADRVFFSATDDSDPRENGRRYTFVRENRSAPTVRRWVPRIGTAAAALLVIGLCLSYSLARVVVTAILAIVGLVLASDHAPTVRLSGDLARVAELSRPRDDRPRSSAATEATGNTTRLDLGALTTDVEPPRPEPPVAVVLETHSDEVTVLADGQGEIRGVPADSLHACRLAEVVMEGSFLSGERLELRIVREEATRTWDTTLVVPFTPSPDRQVLRIARPVEMPLGCAEAPIRSLTLVAPPGSGETVACQVERIALVDTAARFAGRSHGSDQLAAGSTTRPATWQGVPGAFEATAPAGSSRVLKGSLALVTSEPDAVATCRVSALDEAGGATLLHELSISASDSWTAFRVPLLPTEEPQRLRFESQDLPAGAVLAWAGVRAVDTSREPRRVLLVLVDTLRADSLSAYSDQGAPTPRLDALAREGVLFERCFSQCYWTRPSMVSIMSSQYVQATGVQRFERLPGSYTTLAEVFAGAGFYTAAVVSNHNASAAAGLAQGWDELRDEPDHLVDADAARFCSGFVEPRLLELMDEDLLAYVHLMDVHGPYGPTEQPEGWECPPGQAMTFDTSLDRSWNREPTDTSRRELYRLDVANMDAGLGAFLDAMLSRWEAGDGPPAVVAITSDHGEFLGEEGQWSHRNYELHPAVVHVPLLLRAPGLLPSDARVSTTVQNLDVAPTLARLAGIPDDGGRDWKGHDLTGLAHGDGGVGVALSSGGTSTKLFAVYSDRGGVYGRDDRISAILDDRNDLWAQGPTQWTPRGTVLHRDPDTLSRWTFRRVTDGFARAWAEYRDVGDELTAAYWEDVDTSQDLLDPAVLQALEAMGYLER